MHLSRFGVALAVAAIGLASLGAVEPAAADEGAAPIILELSRDHAAAGGGGFYLTVVGQNFTDGSRAHWDGIRRATVFVDSSHLRTWIKPDFLAEPGTHAVTVVNPEPAGASNAVVFRVTQPIAKPSFSTQALMLVTAGSSFTLSWDELHPEAVVTRAVHKQYAPVDIDGGCDVTWLSGWTRSYTSGTTMTGFTAEYCYRWRVTLTNADGVSRSATSRPLRALPAWGGSVDLYRTGVFSTQQTWTWCTAASVQMMVNIVQHRTVHSKSNQQLIFDYEQAHDRYPAGIAGSDPQGQVAALLHFGAGHYTISARTTYASALKAAVKRLRRTGKPVGLYVANGNHAWVLTGFEATRDPAFTSTFSVTAVRVMGPLYPMQKLAHGYYDPPPDTRYTASQFSKILTPYHDTAGGAYSIWEGAYVTLNP